MLEESVNTILNQAVLFTKPLHHLNLSLTPVELDALARTFFEQRGFRIINSRRVGGGELAEREIIREHYLVYSRASYITTPGELELSDDAKSRFKAGFGRIWASEVDAGRIQGNPQILADKGITANDLFLLWNKQFAEKKTQKLQDGVIMAWLEDLDCYCINAFYPAMEENFYHPATEIDYYVVEFDPKPVSWADFRRQVLGVTDASRAEPKSFRGQLYAAHPVEYPGRDNFVHGSAGPFEGFVERAIHEPDFDMKSSPVGLYLSGRGLTLERFRQWKTAQSTTELGSVFDATEERNTAEVLKILEGVEF